MFKRLLTLTICVLASTGLALASEPECPPITVLVPTAAHYMVQNCMAYGLLPDVPWACLNCPGEEAHIFNQTHPMCVQGYREYLTRTVERHLVNGRCVPVETALHGEKPPVPRVEQPIAVAPPMRAAPVVRVGLPAPPPARAPQLEAPHFAPPAAPHAGRAVPQGGRPQP